MHGVWVCSLVREIRYHLAKKLKKKKDLKKLNPDMDHYDQISIALPELPPPPTPEDLIQDNKQRAAVSVPHLIRVRGVIRPPVCVRRWARLQGSK